jgi:hypothetical protein
MMIVKCTPVRKLDLAWLRSLKTKYLTRYEMWTMEPKKDYSEREENGERVRRTTYDDPETKTHVEEIKIEGTEEEPDKEL